MSHRLLGVALLAALVACPAAAGHGGGAARGYTSIVKTVTPKLDGLTVRVVQGDDQLHVRNDSGREVVIQGYEGEPYLRFQADGDVYRNANSPATYLNEARYGGADVKEMHRHKQFGMCCGAGGGRMWMEEKEGKRINVERTEELLATGADEIAVACPFCMTMISDGVKGKASAVPVRDIAEVVASQLAAQPLAAHRIS